MIPGRRHPHLQRRRVLPVRFHLLHLPGRVLAPGPAWPAAGHVPACSWRLRSARRGDGEEGGVGPDWGTGRESGSEMMEIGMSLRMGIVEQEMEKIEKDPRGNGGFWVE